MLTDPQSITYNGVATSLPRVSTAGRSSTYESADGSLRLTVTHTNGRRERSEIRIDHTKVSSDPLFPSQNKPYSLSVYGVVNRPLNTGYTDAEAQLVYDALVGLMADTTFKAKFLGQES